MQREYWFYTVGISSVMCVGGVTRFSERGEMRNQSSPVFTQ